MGYQISASSRNARCRTGTAEGRAGLCEVWERRVYLQRVRVLSPDARRGSRCVPLVCQHDQFGKESSACKHTIGKTASGYREAEIGDDFHLEFVESFWMEYRKVLIL